MSNLFYDYIAKALIEFFETSDLSAGDRFFLRLDKQEDVINLSSAMRENSTAQEFTFKHERGEEYKTCMLPLGGVDLVVAYTSQSVKPDFLVTLRNLVGEQKDEWKNKLLLSIVSDPLDSIQGGSSDLQKEGMPLHPNAISERLKVEIEASNLTKTEQIILLDNLRTLQREQEVQRITFFEFEDIFTILQKGKIEEDDYSRFGLFKDLDLETFKGREQQRRLEENRQLFEYVKYVHDFNHEDEDSLLKRFSPQGARHLKGDDWKNTSFSAVNKFHEDYKKGLKDGKVIYRNFSSTHKLDIWDRSHSETASGKRKRNIILFNPNKLPNLEFRIDFDLQGKITKMEQQYLNTWTKDDNNLKVKVGKNYIYCDVAVPSNSPLFIQMKYRHDRKPTLGAEFNIMIVTVVPAFFADIKSSYGIEAKKEILSLNYVEGDLTFGHGAYRKAEKVEKNEEVIRFSEQEYVTISPQPEAFTNEETLLISLMYNSAQYSVLLENSLQSSVPITGAKLWEKIREKREDVKWIKDTNRLELGNRQYYIHAEYKEFIKWEDTWIENGFRHGKVAGEEIDSLEIQLSEELSEAYSRYLNVFKIKKTISTFSTVSEEVEKRGKVYINAFISEIKSFEEGTVGKKRIDLFKLGTLLAEGTLYFTPFHPLMVAYKLQMYRALKQETVDPNISGRLSVESLLPYIYDFNSNELFKSDYQLAAPEWMVFKSAKKVTVSDANQYLAKLVKDKLTQFKEHFSYLFAENSKAPTMINVINIENDIEVLKGILKWIVEEIQIYKDNTKPLEVTLYKSSQEETAFDAFAFISSVEEFQEKYEISLNKVDGFEKEDVFRLLRNKLLIYKDENFKQMKYAHISFYKMHAVHNFAVQSVRDMNTGISLDGLYTSVPSMKDKGLYKSGFGLKGYSLQDDNLLVSAALYTNELAANLRNHGSDSYRKEEVILSTTEATDIKKMETVFNSSYWVTFVDPAVDLEFFNNYSDDLVVIHYSDQYSSSSRFDAITVTKKSTQYRAVIKEFLTQKLVDGAEENVKNTIKAFNTFNGEWLLRIIGSKGHLDREKLSIVSAIKYSISYFDHPDILWVPISMEEILRVAGAVNLSRRDGIFTAKNLNISGRYSDDLLLFGLETVNEKVYLHFYPVEVKVGKNSNSVRAIAIEQVKKTKKVLVENLTGEAGETFTGEFYKNFFVHLLLANARKMEVSGLWAEKNYSIPDDTIAKLLNAEYEVANHLVHYIGEGAVLSFKKDNHLRSVEMDENVLVMNLPEQDGYEGLVKSIEDLWKWIQHKEMDFVREDMLSYRYKTSSDSNEVLIASVESYDTDQEDKTNIVTEPMKEKTETVIGKSDDQRDSESKGAIAILIEGEPKNTANEELEPIEEKPVIPISKKLELKDVRIKIGKAANSNRDIYWEFGNPSLANRHLLISGGSGQGKTYFMQCLLLEKAKLGLSSIVIDYTEGFLPNQLEPEFVEYLGPKLKQKVVISEKLPINPFKRNVRNIGGLELPESNTDIAERVKSVFASVYKSLGIQQQNAIYESVQEGMDRYGDSMDFNKLKNLLEDAGTSYAKTALSQIRPLIDRDLFDFTETIDWKKITEANGEVFIIQLTLFPRDVQLVITEFILWDIWNYSVRFGNKNHPLPVLMDEAQNLDHTEKSPSARILTEGRKFGWSGWYATQFLKSQLGGDELARLQNAAEKVYFLPPEQELSNVAASLSKDNSEKKMWESRLSHLKKGQCIVHSPILKENGELSTPVPTVVNISPLSERI